MKVVESEHVSSLIWEQQNYTAYIYESLPAHSLVATVRINSSLSTNWKHSSVPVLYGFHSAQDSRSLKLFNIDSVSGSVTVATEPIDRETIPQHIITVKARDSQTYSFVRLLINILDSNDRGMIHFHSPPSVSRLSCYFSFHSSRLMTFSSPLFPSQLLSLDFTLKSEYLKPFLWGV